jgi:hypothetical protein
MLDNSRLNIYKWYYNIYIIIIILIYMPINVYSFPTGVQLNIPESIVTGQSEYTCTRCHTSSVIGETVSSSSVISACSNGSDAIFAGVKEDGTNDDTISIGAFGYISEAFNIQSCDTTAGTCPSLTTALSNGEYWYFYKVTYSDGFHSAFGFSPVQPLAVRQQDKTVKASTVDNTPLPPDVDPFTNPRIVDPYATQRFTMLMDTTPTSTTRYGICISGTNTCTTDLTAVRVIYSCVSTPTRQPSNQPSSQPSNQPSLQPSSQPSMQPSSQPANQPINQPINQSTSQSTN